MRWPWTYRRDLYASVDNAVKLTRQWIDVHHVPVRYIETVAAFERWSKHLGVWFFYETDAQRCHGEESDLSNAMRERFLRALKESGYPDFYRFCALAPCAAKFSAKSCCDVTPRHSP